MGARIKPVEPTVIKDKKIVQEVIAEIHRKPTKKTLSRIQERRKVLKKAMAK
jgi:phosphopantetheine adenylyltransferase